MGVRLICGDALTQLRKLPAESVHCCVTSPPYHQLRDYGVAGQIGLEQTVERYVEKIVEVFREVKRVLRSEGTLWCNLGDSFQGKQLQGVPWKVAFALQEDGWLLRSDVIWHKCLSGGTRVYARTQKGEMPTTVKDLVRLDPATVQLWNGQRWTQVVGFSNTPRPERAIEITLRSGERIGCTPEHRWPTERGLVEAKDLQVGDVIESCTLPEPESPRRPSALDDGLVGWFVGLYLAEGSQSEGTIQIASHQKETRRLRMLKQVAEAFDGYCFSCQTSNNGCTINLNSPVLRGIVEAYVGGKTAKDKHLKVSCWKRTNQFLLGLLQGYLDGDGHYDAENDRWRLGFCRNYALEADLRTLCARVGVQLRLNPITSTCLGESFPAFRGEVRFQKSQHFNAKKDGEVVALAQSRARKFWDIAVQDEPHLFALASGVLTHNSNPMPESVRDRPTKSHEYLFLLAKSEKYYYDADAVREPLATPLHAPGNLKLDASRNDHDRMARIWGSPLGRNRRTVWTVATQPFKGCHFAVFPEKLVEPCVLAGTSQHGVCAECGAPWRRVVERTKYEPPVVANGVRQVDASRGDKTRKLSGAAYNASVRVLGESWQPTCSCSAAVVPATVLDPFAGAATTGVVAQRLGRRFVGIELSPAYVTMAKARLKAARQGKPKRRKMAAA